MPGSGSPPEVDVRDLPLHSPNTFDGPSLAQHLEKLLLCVRNGTQKIDSPREMAKEIVAQFKKECANTPSAKEEKELTDAIAGIILEVREGVGAFAAKSESKLEEAAKRVVLELVVKIGEAFSLEVIIPEKEKLRSSGQRARSFCFLAGTRVLMVDGSSKNIEDVRAGDMVCSCDPDTKEMVEGEVRDITRARREGYWRINNTLLCVTGEHPIYSKNKDGQEGWAVLDRNAAKRTGRMLLRAGDMVFTRDKKWLEVTYVGYVPRPTDVYNLKTVQKHHTFFANGILVHNGIKMG